MTTKTRRLRDSPYIFPFLFAAYPLVFLWAQNVDAGVRGSQALLILAAIWVVTGVVLVLFLLAFRGDAARSALATTVVITMALVFGRVSGALGLAVGMLENDLVLLAWLLLAVAGVLVVRSLRDPQRPIVALNIVSVGLVGLNLLRILPALQVEPSTATAVWQLPRGAVYQPAGPKRDVYYLIFDRYAGERTLRDLYGFDDTPFLQSLRSKGFSVVDDALANYPQTTHSLASSLNMTYLDDLAAAVGEDYPRWAPLQRSFNGPTAAQAFQDIGYRYEHIGSWWAVTWRDPTADDNFIAPGLVYGGSPEFQDVFLGTTVIPTIGSGLRIRGFDPAREAYDRLPHQLESLRTISRDSDPTFTFAHILLPHPPYVFAADGSYVPGDVVRPKEEAYLEQLQYANTVILSVIDTLQSAPGPAPIIVVQSDEGPHPPWDDGASILKQPWSEANDVELGRKLRILNAYYLPGLRDDPVYAGITPVNTFRMILDAYFGADLPLLPDRTYIYADFDHPYRFMDVTQRLQP